MAVAQLAITLHLTAAAEPPTAGAIGILVLIAIAGLELAVLIALSRSGRGGDGDDPDDGDDPGWDRDGPRTPPPDAPVCWPDFEREFAEYVAARAEQDRQAPAS